MRNSTRMMMMNYPNSGYGESMGYSENNMPEIRMDYGGMEYPEQRFNDRRGRPHYDNGRFAPRNEMSYGNNAYSGYGENYGENRMGEFDGARMHKGGSHNEQQMGFSYQDEEQRMPFSQMMAEKWVRGMEDGPHWNEEQVRMIMEQRKVRCDFWEFFAAMNAIYSDYGEVLKKHGLGNKLDLYVDMAKAFIEDEDAQPDKMARYYQCIVQH